MMNTKICCTFLLCTLICFPIIVFSQSSKASDSSLRYAEVALEQSYNKIKQTQASIQSFIRKAEQRRQNLESRLLSAKLIGADTSALHNNTPSTLALRIQNGKGDHNRTNLMYLKRLDSLKMLANYFSTSKKTILLTEEVQSTLSVFSNYNDVIFSRLSYFDNIYSKYSKLGRKEVRAIKKLRENALMCQMRIESLKTSLNDPAKLERKLLEVMSQSTSWKNFSLKNSELTRFFSSTQVSSPTQMKNLQTNEDVVQNLNRKFVEQNSIEKENKSGYPAIVKKELSAGSLISLNSALNTLQMPSFIDGKDFGNSRLADGLSTENNVMQKKSFWQRVEFGWNFQTRSLGSQANAKVHAFGLSVGYKASKTFILGIGTAQEVVSQLPKTLSLSSYGMSMRTYIEGKVSKCWWFASAYEINDISLFGAPTQQAHSPKSSFLLGITRRIDIGKKVSKLQILADISKIGNKHLLSDALLLRIGRNF